MRRKLLTCAFATALLCAELAHAADVVVLATQRIPKVERVIDALTQQLGSAATLQVLDMQGKQQVGERVVRDLAESLTSEQRVVTLGTPASMLATRYLADRSIMSTFVGAEAAKSIRAAGGSVVPSEPDLQQMLSALAATWPSTAKVALLHHPRAKDIADAAAASTGSNIGLIPVAVKSNDAVLETMAQVAPDVDAFVFTRDAKILNRRTLPEIVKFLSEHKVPAVGYSRYLVDAGFPSAVVVDESYIGQTLANELLARDDARNGYATILVNRDFAARMSLQQSQLPEGAKIL